MKIKLKFLSILAVLGLFLPSLPAQVKGNIVWAEYQKPNISKSQYEEARREQVKWFRDGKSPLPVNVWEVISGERAGQYLVTVSVKGWDKFDESQGLVTETGKRFLNKFEANAIKVHPFFLDHLIEVSRDSDAKTPATMIVLRYYKVAYGKWGDFYSLLRKFKEAAEEGNYPVRYSWFSVTNGMEEPVFVEAVPKKDWAEMAPPPKAPLQLAMDLFGPEETISMTNLMGQVIEKENSEILKYRADLSYIPEGGE